MKIALQVLAGTAVALAGAATVVVAQTTDEHKIMLPHEIEWSPGPAELPPGAEVSVLYGDPGKEGCFALRLKLPKGYHIPPRSHPKPQIITVISGAFRLGMGETANPSKAKPLPAGGFAALSPDMAHFAYSDDETVIQLHSFGPWRVAYVNPTDDPRNLARNRNPCRG